MSTPDTAISVLGRRWDTSRPESFLAPEGMSLEHIITSSIERAYREHVYTRAQYRSLLRYARCRVNGTEIDRKAWASTYPVAGSRVEILHGVRGGGGGGDGGKNPIATVLSAIVVVVATIATWWAGGAGGAAAAAAMGITQGVLKVGISLLAMGALYAINALFPAAKPSLGNAATTREAEKVSQAYSINGGRNSAQVGGYIPFICGRHRFTPPLGGRSWTCWEGQSQFFHMLVVWGHCDVTVSDFRIGETPLSSFKDVQHIFHQAGYGTDMQYFGRSYNEQSVGAVLKSSEGWNTRTVGESQAISLDFAFQRGLVHINKKNGDRKTRSVQIQVQYREKGTATWYGLGGDGNYIFSAATQNVQMRSVSINGLPLAVYEVRCRRVTADTDESYIMDECQWSVMRAIINKPAFKTDIPLCYSELRIRASDQLSGYVSDFNALCHSTLPDWNGSAWVVKTTSNPASIMRYMLTSRHCLAKPYSTAKLDNAKLVELWNYCNSNGYQFNYICDSETALWERLVQVLAPGRAAPTTDVDGKWGVVIDRSGKTPVQLFTPRNSWGMSVQRGFAELPHALRVTFRDETHNYEERHAYVYNDGYNANNATDIVEWDFPGITNWNRIWKQGRLYLARALHRQMSITLSTDWEWLACRRGDLVGVASDVLMNVFGTARITALVYQVEEDGATVEVIAASAAEIPVDGRLVGVRLDDTLYFSEPSPARYGIAVRSSAGAMTTWELQAAYGEEREILYFRNPPATTAGLDFGALVSVSLLGEEYDEYLVAALSPQDNNVCEVSLIPYKIREIEAAMSGTIPSYAESILLDQLFVQTLPTPVIRVIKSDESVLGGSRGASIPRIAVWWEMPASKYTAADMTLQISATDVETGEVYHGSASGEAEYVWVEGVQEKRLYDVRVRAVHNSGVASTWSATVRHVCVGRTTPPPAPTQVYMDGTVARITQRERPQDVVGHVVYMVMDEGDPISYAKRLTATHTTTGTFDLAPWMGYARRVYVTAVDELGLESAPVSVGVNLGDVLPDNVLFTISQRAADWAGSVTNGAIVAGVLRADEAVTLWSEDSAAPVWPALDAMPLWPAGNAREMVYAWSVEIPLAYAGAHVRVEPQALSGRLLSLEYRVAQEKILWGGDAVPLWQQNTDDNDLATPLWPEPVYSEWQPWSSSYTATGADKLMFRAAWAGGDERAALTDILTVIDVPDREWAVEDLPVPAEGANVPVPAGFFRAVTNVVASLQYNDGDTGLTVVRVPGALPVDTRGYLTVGPMVRVLDATRVAVAGNIDVRLKGY